MDELTPQERAGLIGYLLGCGCRMRTRDVARLTGMSMRGALHLLEKLSRNCPIYQNGWVWQKCDENEAPPVVQ